jgi:glucose dehydrogenase
MLGVMGSWTSFLSLAAVYFALAMWRLVEVSFEWWSIFTVAILFAAAGAALARAFVERRRSLTLAPSPQ